MLRVNAINRQELLKCLTFNPKSLVFKTVSVPCHLCNILCGDYGTSGSYNVAIGTEAGAHHINDSFCFYLDNIPRVNNIDEREKGLMFGKFDTIPNNQSLSINAGLIILPYLPSIDPHILGALWNNNGVLRISSGI